MSSYAASQPSTASHKGAYKGSSSCSTAQTVVDGLETKEEALDKLLKCLSDPSEVCRFFRRGDGAPDVLGISRLVSSLTDIGTRQRIMDVLSIALRGSQPYELEKACSTMKLRIDGDTQLTTADFAGGPNAVLHAWYGAEDTELLDLGYEVTDKVRHLLWEDGFVQATPDVFDEGRVYANQVLTLSIEVQTSDSAVIVKNDKASQASEGNELTSEGSDSSWLTVALAAGLPLIEGGLPKDDRGVCILPHQHPMGEVQADVEGKPQRVREGRHVWDTGKVCDRCMDSISDRVYYHCSKGCDVDFCSQCEKEIQGVLGAFFDKDQDNEYISQRMLWIVHFIDEVSLQILHRSTCERMVIANLLASEWPLDLFQQLVDAVVNVCNAKLLYNCMSGALATSVTREDAPGGKVEYTMESLPLYQDSSYNFWYTIGLLQFLYECSGLCQQEKVLDSHEERGHKIPVEKFILEGINKCNPRVEWDQWEISGGSNSIVNVLRAPKFQCSSSFRSLAVHNNLLPISFRRACVIIDIQKQMHKVGSIEALRIEVEREPHALIDNVCNVFSEASSEEDKERGRIQHLCRPLHVSFKGEAYRTGVAAQGPGVTREFFQVALRAFLAALFVDTGKRTYWFSDVSRPEACFSCGVLLGQVIRSDVLIPNVFPWPFYDLLLRDLDSPRACNSFTLQHLAAVSQAEADSLGKVRECMGDDITETFGDLGWDRVPSLAGKTLTQATKDEFINAYIDWSFGAKIADRFGPLSSGFRAVVGNSVMVRKMVDAKQLERIACGGEFPVDIAAIRRRCCMQNWDDSDEAYIELFWQVLQELAEDAKLKFVIFVTGSDRVPLQGWEDLRVKIQKNGKSDSRLPTAYTCFSLVLLPKYSSRDILRNNLVSAISDSQGFGLQ